MARTPADQPYNVILTGSFGVGKSSLFQKLSGEVHADYQYGSLRSTNSSAHQFDRWTHSALVNEDTVQASVEFNLHKITLPLKSAPFTRRLHQVLLTMIHMVKVTLWDTGNLERTGLSNVTRSYFRHAVGIILVYDIGDRETLDALYDWVFYIKNYISWQWQKCVTFVVWGNNRDQTLTAVSNEQLKSFLTHLELSENHHCEVNAYTGCSVLESYQFLIERIHQHLNPKAKDVYRPDINLDSEGISTASSCSC